MCSAIARAVHNHLNDERLKEWLDGVGKNRVPQDQLTSLLEHWSKLSTKPVVLLLDEVDALIGNTLISLLRQIRAGYDQRPAAFPQSVILCGVRDVRDYRMHGKGEEVITGGSAFNITAESLRMGNFN